MFHNSEENESGNSEEDVKTLKDDLRRMTKKCRRLEEKFDEKTAKTEAPCTSAQ